LRAREWRYLGSGFSPCQWPAFP